MFTSVQTIKHLWHVYDLKQKLGILCAPRAMFVTCIKRNIIMLTLQKISKCWVVMTLISKWSTMRNDYVKRHSSVSFCCAKKLFWSPVFVSRLKIKSRCDEYCVRFAFNVHSMDVLCFAASKLVGFPFTCILFIFYFWFASCLQLQSLKNTQNR